MKKHAAFGVMILMASASAMLAGAPAFAHDMSAQDMSAMSGHDMASAPNAMGGHMGMDAHMVMTESRPQTPADLERARNLLATLRKSISEYSDSQVALDQGYQIFLPQIQQDVYHFTDYALANREYAGLPDPRHPGSLLYEKDSAGRYVLVGAMYSAPPSSSPEKLDAIVPLSVARWHAHTNICLPNGITLLDLLHGDVGATREYMPGMMPVAAAPATAEGINHRLGFLADGRFGFTGKIADEAECKDAGGHFVKQAFGWMVHVYPFSGDDLSVAFGTSVPKLPAN